MPLLRALSVLFLMKQKAVDLTGDAWEPVFHTRGPRNNKQPDCFLHPSYADLIYTWERSEVVECALKSRFKEPDSFTRSFNTHQLCVEETGMVQRTPQAAGIPQQTCQVGEAVHLPSPRGVRSTLPSSPHFQMPESSSQPIFPSLLEHSIPQEGFPDGSISEESTCSAGYRRDVGLIPGSGRSSGGGNGNPLQYSCLENAMDTGAWWVTIHGVTESDTTEAT